MNRLVLVTGASAGIGEAFARAYAARGWDLAVTARRTERLEALAAELSALHGVDAFAVPADLADPEAPGRLLAAIEGRGRQLDGLVNNAGYGLRGPLHDQDERAQAAMLQVMVGSVTALTRSIVPGMRERGFGRVINVASLMGLIPGGPRAGLYSGAKQFVVGFSEALHMENRRSGVNVTCLCPGLVRSEFHIAARMTEEVAHAPGWMWMQAEPVVQAAIAAVEANRPLCTPGLVNQAIVFAANALPRPVAMRLIGRALPRI